MDKKSYTLTFTDGLQINVKEEKAGLFVPSIRGIKNLSVEKADAFLSFGAKPSSLNSLCKNLQNLFGTKITNIH